MINEKQKIYYAMLKYANLGIMKRILTVLSILVLGLFIIEGCVSSSNQPASRQEDQVSTEQQQNITGTAPTNQLPAEKDFPFDRVLAEVSIISKTNKQWYISINKIREYSRYEKATYPTLKIDDKINIFVAALFEPNNPQMGEGKPVPTVGKKYLAQLDMCYSKESLYGCEPGKDWLAFLSSLEPTVSAKLKIINPLNGSRIAAGQTITIKVEAADSLSRKLLLVTPWVVETLIAPMYEIKLVVPLGTVGPQTILAIGGDRENKDEITIIVVS